VGLCGDEERARTPRQNDTALALTDATDRHTCGVESRQVVVMRSGEVGPGRRPGVAARRSRRRRSPTPVAGSAELLVELSRGQGRPQAARRAWP
jgi:hypothetical protein